MILLTSQRDVGPRSRVHVVVGTVRGDGGSAFGLPLVPKLDARVVLLTSVVAFQPGFPMIRLAGKITILRNA